MFQQKNNPKIVYNMYKWAPILVSNFPSCCSRQGLPLWNCGNFDHFSPLPTTLNVIWLQKVVPNLPFTYLGKVKKNWQLFPFLFFGESQKYVIWVNFGPNFAPWGMSWYILIFCLVKYLCSIFLGRIFVGGIFLGQIFLGRIFHFF